MAGNEVESAQQLLLVARNAYSGFEECMDEIERNCEDTSVVIGSSTELYIKAVTLFERLALEEVQSVRIGDLKKCSFEESAIIRLKAIFHQIDDARKKPMHINHSSSNMCFVRNCDTVIKAKFEKFWRPRSIKLFLPSGLDQALSGLAMTYNGDEMSSGKKSLNPLHVLVARWVITGLPPIQRDVTKIKKSSESVGRDGIPIKFNRPYGLAIHPFTNRVYVADRENSRIVMLNGEDLSLIGTFRKYGNGPEDLFEPVAIAVSPDGMTVAISDQYNHRVVLADSETGNHIRTLVMKNADTPVGISSPHGICYDSRGHLYVADNDIGLVLHFDPKGELINTIGMEKGIKTIGQPEGLAIIDDDILIAVGSGQGVVHAFSPVTGELLRSFNIKPLAKGAVNSNTLARGPDGGFVVCDRNHDVVVFYSASGDFLHSFTAAHPMGAIFDRWNRLLLPCTDERVIYIC